NFQKSQRNRLQRIARTCFRTDSGESALMNLFFQKYVAPLYSNPPNIVNELSMTDDPEFHSRKRGSSAANAHLYPFFRNQVSDQYLFICQPLARRDHNFFRGTIKPSSPPTETAIRNNVVLAS